jgi:hypothetical protein
MTNSLQTERSTLMAMGQRGLPGVAGMGKESIVGGVARQVVAPIRLKRASRGRRRMPSESAFGACRCRLHYDSYPETASRVLQYISISFFTF